MKRRDNASHKIAEVALRLLENEGADGVTLRRVAREVGITPMAIYNHFPDRDALLKRVTDGEFDRLMRFAEARIKKARTDSPLLNMVDAYLDYALARPKVFDYLFSTPRPDARRFPTDFRARRSPTLNLIADAVADGIRAEELKKDDVWEIAMTVWAHEHGCIALYRGGRFALSEKQFRAFYRRSLRRLLEGLRTQEQTVKAGSRKRVGSSRSDP